MVAPNSFSKPQGFAARGDLDCEKLAQYAGEGPCGDVLLALCNRERDAEETSVWDIHRITGLPLHEAFAALRTLEYGRIVEIRDNPSDPFGAMVSMRDDGVETLRKRSAA